MIGCFRFGNNSRLEVGVPLWRATGGGGGGQESCRRSHIRTQVLSRSLYASFTLFSSSRSHGVRQSNPLPRVLRRNSDFTSFYLVVFRPFIARPFLLRVSFPVYCALLTVWKSSPRDDFRLTTKP